MQYENSQKNWGDWGTRNRTLESTHKPCAKRVNKCREAAHDSGLSGQATCKRMAAHAVLSIPCCSSCQDRLLSLVSNRQGEKVCVREHITSSLPRRGKQSVWGSPEGYFQDPHNHRCSLTSALTESFPGAPWMHLPDTAGGRYPPAHPLQQHQVRAHITHVCTPKGDAPVTLVVST